MYKRILDYLSVLSYLIIANLLFYFIFLKTQKMRKETIAYLREFFRIPKGKRLRWCIVKEVSQSGTELRLGVMFVGTNLYIDVAERRFFSATNCAGVERSVYQAWRKSLPNGCEFSSSDGGLSIQKPRNYIADLYRSAVYDKELLGEVIL